MALTEASIQQRAFGTPTVRTEVLTAVPARVIRTRQILPKSITPTNLSITVN